jgi:hypothetical protein
MLSNRNVRALYPLLLLLLLLATSTQVLASSLSIKQVDDKKLTLSYKANSLTLVAAGNWISDGKSSPTYSYSGNVTVDKITFGSVAASVGPNGIIFTTSAGFTFGEQLVLSAGALTFEITSGDQIKNGPSLATFGTDDMVLYASINNSASLTIGSDTKINLPGAGGISASIVVEFKHGTFYYEGPIPTPVTLAANLASSIKPSGGSTTKGGLGFSLNNSFSYKSDVSLYSDTGVATSESFDTNLIIAGELNVHNAYKVDGTMMIDLKNGKAGVNAPATASLSLFSAAASVQFGDASMVADSKGLRFGVQEGIKVVSFPSSLASIESFITPLVNAPSTEINGYIENTGKFSIEIKTSSLNIGAIPLKNPDLKLSSSGLDISATLTSGGLGSMSLSGTATNQGCSLSVDKLKVFGFSLGSPTLKPCQAVASKIPFAGTIKVLGKSIKVAGDIDINDAKNGTMNALDQLSFDIGGLTINAGKIAATSGQEGITLGEAKLAAFSNMPLGDLPIGSTGALSKGVNAEQSYSFKKKEGLSGLGYVKVSGNGDINLSLQPSGTSISLTSDTSLSASAKFCVGTKIAGQKIKKCKKNSTTVHSDFNLNTGCFKLGGGEKVKILGKSVGYPDKVCFNDNDDVDTADELASDEVGVSLALRAPNGQYIQWQTNSGDTLKLSSTIDDHVYFTMQKTDATQCIKESDLVSLRSGDIDTLPENRYVRQKNKGGSVDTGAAKVDDQKKRFSVSFTNMKGACLSDGDQIKLKNKEYKQYMTVMNSSTISGHSSADDSTTLFTVVFNP